MTGEDSVNALSGACVLVVDDEPDVAEGLVAMLEAGGYSALTAHTAAEARRIVQGSSPQAALLDIRLGEDDGLALMTELKALQPDLCCILMTGQSAGASAAAALQKGACAYLEKPSNMRQVLAELERCLDKFRLRRAEQLLSKSERRFAQLVQTMNEGLWIQDAAGQITFVNDRLCRMLGFAPDELPGRSADDALCGAAPTAKPSAVPRRVDLAGRDGRPIPVLMSFRPMLDENGHADGGFAVVTDITEHERLEDQYRHAQQMESVGRVAGGVAHDFNNQLTVIKGYCDLMLGTMDESEPSFPLLTEIRDAAKRAHDLTSQLLAFSRKQVLRPEVIDVNALLTRLENPLARMIGEDVELAIIPDQTVGRVEIDPSQLEQAVMNLVVNARDAMGEGGKLTIETASVRIDEEYCLEHPDATPGPHVLLAVTDTGQGMDEATRQKAFEPFFTTKDKGKGTGLGLSMVYGFVRQSGGDIDIYGGLGRGTTVKIYLPSVAGETPAEGPNAVLPAGADGNETVLVVEEDESVRQLVVRVLRKRGYTVLETANAREAVPLGEHYEGDIQLLVTDVAMPGMSGPELARRVQATREHMPVLFITGCPKNAVVRQGAVAAGHTVLTKPFSPSELAIAVRSVLDGANGDRAST